MAGRKLTVKGKVRASTLLEVLISMIIILIVFIIGMMIFGNVSRLSLSAQKIKAESVLEEKLLNVEQSKINIDETVTVGDLQIEQEIKLYSNNSHLSVVHLIAWDNNHIKIAELQKVILTNE
ncbi:MAG TPA: hypothetical protein VFE54_11595 [Mucilaginibacter sp.]|jgi:hypothetical protein|nr:hypothetical protein [Mucilaginibacter sp.]